MLQRNEFATNSVKYGALMDAEGRIAVDFETGQKLTLTWTESGGPPIPSTAVKQGFGGVLVDATIASLGGTIERNWSGNGFKEFQIRSPRLSASLPDNSWPIHFRPMAIVGVSPPYGFNA